MFRLDDIVQKAELENLLNNMETKNFRPDRYLQFSWDDIPYVVVIFRQYQKRQKLRAEAEKA